MVISTNGEINLLYPANWEVPEEASRIERNSSLVVPRPGEGSFQVQGTSGFPEILLLASKEPLRNVFRAMQRIAQSRGISTSPVMGLRDDEPTIFSSSLLGDLENLSSGFNNDGGFVQRTGKDFISYETSTMAVLSAVIEVVD